MAWMTPRRPDAVNWDTDPPGWSAIAVTLGQEVEWKGWMRKQSRKHKRWQSRFFVLTKTFLAYYHESVQRENMPLKRVLLYTAEYERFTDPSQTNSSQHFFVDIAGERRIPLECKDADTANRVMRLILTCKGGRKMSTSEAPPAFGSPSTSAVSLKGNSESDINVPNPESEESSDEEAEAEVENTKEISLEGFRSMVGLCHVGVNIASKPTAEHTTDEDRYMTSLEEVTETNRSLLLGSSVDGAATIVPLSALPVVACINRDDSPPQKKQDIDISDQLAAVCDVVGGEGCELSDEYRAMVEELLRLLAAASPVCGDQSLPAQFVTALKATGV